MNAGASQYDGRADDETGLEVADRRSSPPGCCGQELVRPCGCYQGIQAFVGGAGDAGAGLAILPDAEGFFRAMVGVRMRYGGGEDFGSDAVAMCHVTGRPPALDSNRPGGYDGMTRMGDCMMYSLLDRRHDLDERYRASRLSVVAQLSGIWLIRNRYFAV